MHTGTNAEVPVCVPTATVFVAASALKPGAAKASSAAAAAVNRGVRRLFVFLVRFSVIDTVLIGE